MVIGGGLVPAQGAHGRFFLRSFAATSVDNGTWGRQQHPESPPPSALLHSSRCHLCSVVGFERVDVGQVAGQASLSFPLPPCAVPCALPFSSAVSPSCFRLPSTRTASRSVTGTVRPMMARIYI